MGEDRHPFAKKKELPVIPRGYLPTGRRQAERFLSTPLLRARDACFKRLNHPRIRNGMVMEFGTTMTTTLGAITLLGNAALFALFPARIFSRAAFDSAMRLLGRFSLEIGFFLAASSLVGSLIYSEIVGYPACILCWMSRIFMYPLPFLFGLAYWRKELTILPYTFFLSAIGIAIAGYQWGKEMLLLYGGVLLPCPAVADLPSCDRLYVLEYGYITIAMIALNAFLWIALVSWAGMRYRQRI